MSLLAAGGQRGHDPRRSSGGLGPHPRGLGAGRSRRRARRRGQPAGRPADGRAGRRATGAAAAGRSRGRDRDPGGAHQPRPRKDRSERRQGGRDGDRAGAPARALFHPGHRALGRGAAAIITSGSTPTAATRSGASSPCRPPGSSSGRSSNSCARSKPACASMSRSSMRCRSASTRRPNSPGPAPCWECHDVAKRSPTRARPEPIPTSPARMPIRVGSRCPARPSRMPSRRSPKGARRSA